MKLYHIKTRVPEFSGRRDVLFYVFKSWPTTLEPPPHPYAELIKDYKIGASAESYIDELFTEDEAQQVKAYIDELFAKDEAPVMTTLSEVGLPVDNDLMGIGAMSIGKREGFIRFYKQPNYPLPFKIEAYFNLDVHELVGGRDDGLREYREYCEPKQSLKSEVEAALAELRKSPQPTNREEYLAWVEVKWEYAKTDNEEEALRQWWGETGGLRYQIGVTQADTKALGEKLRRIALPR